MIAPRIAASFAAQGLMQGFGAVLEQASEGRCRLWAPITPAVSQQHGHAHAGLTFALGDTAAGYAALSLMPDGAEVLTVEIKINLLAPARGRRLIALGEVLRAGRRLSVVRADVMAEAEDGTTRLVAALQGTMIPV